MTLLLRVFSARMLTVNSTLTQTFCEWSLAWRSCFSQWTVTWSLQEEEVVVVEEEKEGWWGEGGSPLRNFASEHRERFTMLTGRKDSCCKRKCHSCKVDRCGGKWTQCCLWFSENGVRLWTRICSPHCLEQPATMRLMHTNKAKHALTCTPYCYIKVGE